MDESLGRSKKGPRRWRASSWLPGVNQDQNQRRRLEASATREKSRAPARRRRYKYLRELVGAAGTAGLCVFGDDRGVSVRREIGHVGHCGVAECSEFGPIALRDWIGGGQAEAFEIQELAVLLDAEIEMGAGGEAGHADEADGPSLFDVLAGVNEDAGEMHVISCVAVGVLDFD